MDFRKRYKISHEMILFIGRKSKYKGASALLDAAYFVWKEFPNTKFVFIGPEEGDFIKPRDERIVSIGAVNEGVKVSAFTACDIFCIPSKHEVLPLSILEAWWFKKPVIAGDIDYLRGLIDDGVSGILVKPNPQSIADAIIKLLKNPETMRMLGENGYKTIKEIYTKEKVVEKIEQIFLRLARGHS